MSEVETEEARVARGLRDLGFDDDTPREVLDSAIAIVERYEAAKAEFVRKGREFLARARRRVGQSAEARAAYAQHGTWRAAALALGVTVGAVVHRARLLGPLPVRCPRPTCSRVGCSQTARRKPASDWCSECLKIAEHRGEGPEDLPAVGMLKRGQRSMVTVEQAEEARSAFERLGSWPLADKALGLGTGGARYRARKYGPMPPRKFARGEVRPECARGGCVSGVRFGSAGCQRCEQLAERRGVSVADLPPIDDRAKYGAPITPEVVAAARAAYVEHGTHDRAAKALGVSVLTLRRRINRGGPMAHPKRRNPASLPRCARPGCARSSRPRSPVCEQCQRVAADRGVSVVELPPIPPRLPPQTPRAAKVRELAAAAGSLAALGLKWGLSRERIRQLANEEPRKVANPKGGRPRTRERRGGA